MTYQPSPYQTQTPAFASPLDQLATGFSDSAGPSGSRGAILDRAFSLTRGNRVVTRKNDAQKALNERNANQQQRPVNVQASQSKVDDTADRARIQRLREVRLSQQQNLVEGRSLPTQHGPSQIHSMTNAFRDSIASDISFNTISGAQDRSSMMMDAMLRSPNAGRENVVSNVDTDIARELHGLALRRRPSLDTVRSSEFGDEGRWAKAWAGSDDEEEEDEMDLQAMRAHNLSDFDLESRPQRHAAGLGALGDLGNLSGARAAMHQQTTLAQQQRSPQSAFQLPELKSVSGAEHAVNVTSAQVRRADRGMTNAGTGYDRGLLPRAHQPQRRDTLISIAGEVGEIAQDPDEEVQVVSSASAASSPDSTHVKVWPPTPAGTQRRTGGGRYNGSEEIVPAGSKRDTLLARNIGQGQSANVMQGSNDLQNRQKALPVSPSAAITQGHAVWPTSSLEEQPANNSGYSDPNRPAAGEIALDGLGERRRRAIAQHGGRESLVSDLDVVTLRLDGASTVAGDRADLSSRRGSNSTIGTVSSDVLDEMRKRRSQMEHEDAIAAGLAADKRSSTATVRNVSTARLEGQGRPSGSPPIPRRSNTNPEDQQQQYKVNAQLSPAPWATQNATRPLRNSTGADGLPAPSPFQLRSPTSSQAPTLSSTKPQRSPSSSSAPPPPQSQAEKFLTLGITHHESGDLSRSAYYFERSAKVDGGCVVGMCMWGMALREGWGVRKDQKRGFEWISRAASRAGELMAGPKGSATASTQKTEAELKAIRSELKLSVYELGKCFCYGWGVKMDKQMALEYFELAAKLGDSDAQAEAGALLAAGKGCKKDLKKAAMYYRMAEAQGYDTVGLSWIHKDKYDPAGQTPTSSTTATTKWGR